MARDENYIDDIAASKEKSGNGGLIAGLVILSIGLIVLCTGGFFILKNAKKYSSYKTVEALVVDNAKMDSYHKVHHTVGYAPMLEYSVDGEVYISRDKYFKNPANYYEIGKWVTAYYDPDDPSIVTTDTSSPIGWFVMILGFAVSGFSVMGLVGHFCGEDNEKASIINGFIFFPVWSGTFSMIAHAMKTGNGPKITVAIFGFAVGFAMAAAATRMLIRRKKAENDIY